MGKRDTYRTTLTYALAIAGGKVELARLLKVKVPQLLNWLNAVDDIPDRVFFDAIDIVSRSTPEAISRSRELLSRISRPVSPE